MTPLAPGSTLGILGGGQLGRMLSQAASRLGFNVGQPRTIGLTFRQKFGG